MNTYEQADDTLAYGHELVGAGAAAEAATIFAYAAKLFRDADAPDAAADAEHFADNARTQAATS